ncbi:MAG: hypothetical protein IPG34_18165 [Rhodocyclaceae bacterium]|nr:hypothetical protein [Rhodocyclaceae bacterium]
MISHPSIHGCAIAVLIVSAVVAGFSTGRGDYRSDLACPPGVTYRFALGRTLASAGWIFALAREDLVDLAGYCYLVEQPAFP